MIFEDQEEAILKILQQSEKRNMDYTLHIEGLEPICHMALGKDNSFDHINESELCAPLVNNLKPLNIGKIMTVGSTILENIEYNRLQYSNNMRSLCSRSFFNFRIVNTSDACSPAETMAESFYPIDGSTNVALDSQMILKASGSSGGFPFSFTLNTNETEVDGEITELCNAADHLIYLLLHLCSQ